MSNKTLNFPVGMPSPPTFAAYYKMLYDCGLGTGPVGSQELAPKVKPIVEALHRVLAGGSVTITTDSQGDQADFDQMEALLKQSLAESNEINGKGGYALLP